MIGEIINDKYKIESVFTESHMYELFTAIELSTGSTVVLKLMKEEMAVSTERVKNFSEEIKNFASLSHPMIAEILDLDMFEGRPYVVSPLIKGKELNRVIKDEVLSLPDSVKIIQDLAAVLQCAADKKIENRNINLSNILRREDGHVVVLSFTLPRLKLVSTAPVKKSDNSGVQSDLYFLGTAFFELLAGESPIRKLGGLNELWDMKLEQFMRIRHPEIEPDMQDKLVGFISKTFTRNMTQRFNSYEEFLKALADLAGKIRKDASQRNRTARQLSMASNVMDALNGKLNSTSAISQTPVASKASNESLATSASLVSNKAAKQQQTTGFAEVSTEGNLALVVDNDIRENDEQTVSSKNAKKTSKAKLHVVKTASKKTSGKTKAKQPSEWAEEQTTIKSPVVIMGLILSIMVTLILFW